MATGPWAYDLTLKAGLLTVADAAHALASDNMALTVHTGSSLAVDSAAHAVTSGNPTLTAHGALAIDNATHALASDAPDLAQHATTGPWAYDLTLVVPTVLTLAVDNAGHGVVSGVVTLGEWTRFALAAGSTGYDDYSVADGTTYQYRVAPEAAGVPSGWTYADPVTFELVLTLAIDSAAHAATSSAVALAQHNILAVDGMVDAVTSTAPGLVQHHALLIASSTHTLASDVPNLTQRKWLAVDGSAHAVTSTAADLAQTHKVAIAGATHVVSSASPTITQHHVVAVAVAWHALTSSSPDLVQHQVVHLNDLLAVDNTVHAVASDTVALVQGKHLAINDAFDAIVSDLVTLEQFAQASKLLSLFDGELALDSDDVQIRQRHIVAAVDDCYHALHSGGVFALVREQYRQHISGTVTVETLPGGVTEITITPDGSSASTPLVMDGSATCLT
jgi:hypothetical protein